MPAFDYGYNGGQSSPINPGYTVPKTKANTMPSGNERAAYEKAMADRYANTVVSPGLFGTTFGQQKGYTGQGAAGGRSPSLASNNNSGGGGLSMSFGGGGGGRGGAPAAPSNVLNTRQFAPYESTYTPPTPATPDPYNYATRDPYTYGEGLSNAGAAYDIWGSKPGTNPYRLTTPDSYKPGLLGLDPVTLPGNMNNKGADISAFTPASSNRVTTGIPPRGPDYTGSGYHGARNSGVGGNPYPVGHPLNQGPSGQAAARIAADAKIKSYADASAAGKGIGSKYTTKKASTKAAVSSYRSNKAGTISTPTFKPNYDATKGPLRF